MTKNQFKIANKLNLIAKLKKLLNIKKEKIKK